MLRSIEFRPNVTIISNTLVEIYYANSKNVSLGTRIIKPVGKKLYHKECYDISNIFRVPRYHNETIMMNLSKKLNDMGIPSTDDRFLDGEYEKTKGVICIPYAYLTWALFESFAHGVIYFVPSFEFLLEISKTPNFWFQPPFSPETLRMSEWYNDDHKDLFVYYNSWEDLKYKTENLDYTKQKKKINDFYKIHEENTLRQWKEVLTL